MAQCNSFLLFLIILTAFLTSGQLSLFPRKLFLCISIEHRIFSSFTGRKHTHSLHRKIDPNKFFCRSFFCCLFFTAKQKTGKIFSGWLPADCHRFQFPFFWYRTVKLHSDSRHLRQFQIFSFQKDISIHYVCCIRFSWWLLWFETWKSCRWFTKKLMECAFQMQLYIC